MTIGTLTRFGRLPDAMFGIIQAGAFRGFTVERPWRDNARLVSCIPLGEYDLVEHSSQKYPDTVALAGLGVTHFEDPGSARYGILLHPANFAHQVQGCVAPGLRIGYVNGELGVQSSRDALKMLLHELGPGDRLIVKYATS